MDCVVVKLELPPAELNPNKTVGTRGSRMAKANKVKQYRSHACDMAYVGVFDSGLKTLGWDRAVVSVLWRNEVKNRRPDPDNALAYLKPAFDGLTDSGVLSDDRDIVYLPVQFEKVPAGEGGVVLTITKGDLTQEEFHGLFRRFVRQ